MGDKYFVGHVEDVYKRQEVQSDSDAKFNMQNSIINNKFDELKSEIQEINRRCEPVSYTHLVSGGTERNAYFVFAGFRCVHRYRAEIVAPARRDLL